MARPEGFEPPTTWFVARYSDPTELRALKGCELCCFSAMKSTTILSNFYHVNSREIKMAESEGLLNTSCIHRFAAPAAIKNVPDIFFEPRLLNLRFPKYLILPTMSAILNMAESEGFEPSMGF